MDPDRLLLVGFHHRRCPAELRLRLYREDDEVPALLASLRRAGIAEALALSTCDRVAVLGLAGPGAGDAAEAVVAGLAKGAGLPAGLLAPHAEVTCGAAAAASLFRIAAGLDSQVIGEPQVLGQLKAAHRLAADLGHVGPGLGPLLRAAEAAARRVRAQTAIGEGPVSLAAAAGHLVRDVHGDITRCQALLLGMGELGEFLADHFLKAGLGRIQVAARTPRRAAALAGRLGGSPVEDLAAALAGADIVLAATGEGRYVVTGEAVEGALRRRRRRPMLLLDLAHPGDVEPAVHRLDGAFLFEVADLERIAGQGRAARAGAVAAAEAILGEELARFARAAAERPAGALIAALHAHVEGLRAAALAEAAGDAEKATRLLAGRLLHAPTLALKDIAAEGGVAEGLVRRLFGLEDGS
ncbi:MAG: glutamyl-tRNA reductase [Thalassobaculales bacterium]